MKNFLIIVFLVIIGYLLLNEDALKNYQPSKNYSTQSRAHFSALSNTKVLYANGRIPNNIKQVIESSSELKSAYDNNKKIIIYVEDPNTRCFFVKSLSLKIESLRKNSLYSNYVFVPNFVDPNYSGSNVYSSTRIKYPCTYFCAIKPRTGEIFHLGTIGRNEIDNIDKIFSLIRQW